MATWLDQRWEPALGAPGSRDRRGGIFHAYRPDELADRPISLPPPLGRRANQVERAIADLVAGPEIGALEGLARFLLRSEAIASSRIEGLQVSARQVALAELAEGEGLGRGGFTSTAQLVANNVTVLRAAASSLVEADVVSVDGIEDLHRALLPDEQLHGVRSAQNWIGGSAWNPLEADFVPPPARLVQGLMEDLTDYVDNATAGPLVHAALVHAQFETIHPFVDGNGRVGRALIHTVLTRRGLTQGSVLPVSLVLLTRSEDYIRGLAAFRHTGSPTSRAANDGLAAWVELFVEAASTAVDQARTFADQLRSLTSEWEERLSTARVERGVREKPRSGSGVARLLELLPGTPIMTTKTVQRLLGDISFPPARAALEELAEAGIVVRQQLDGRTTGYLATEVFDLLTIAERRLASTRWDTRESAPARPVPARPQRGRS
ncbi:Fic family protein [Actinomycetospora succinea]|uniref:Fic family protein n=1 Tax=Actinomycetospora succinea TaxID=663603 RepID=A0A4R6VIN3_9PSEU|nr:Fic family protein [Actinomycetospora succinea]TDQ62984.1 Fic family protein [Actinomycetospora succinea]